MWSVLLSPLQFKTGQGRVIAVKPLSIHLHWESRQLNLTGVLNQTTLTRPARLRTPLSLISMWHGLIITASTQQRSLREKPLVLVSFRHIWRAIYKSHRLKRNIQDAVLSEKTQKAHKKRQQRHSNFSAIYHILRHQGLIQPVDRKIRPCFGKSHCPWMNT